MCEKNRKRERTGFFTKNNSGDRRIKCPKSNKIIFPHGNSIVTY